MHHYIESLQQIGSVFKKDQNDFLELSNTIASYKKIVTELTTLDLDSEANKESIHFNNGKALGTTWAAMCIDDLLRTKLFISGVFKAVEMLLQKQKKGIHILYAGTGPYATLLLPIFASFSPDQVQATVIEINEQSFKNMKEVIQKLGFEKHIISYENKDATTIQLKNPETIDIVLSETLQCGLIKEQQIPITINLLNQVPKNTILIPELLALDICLLNYRKFKNRISETDEMDFNLVLDRLIEINNQSNEKYPLNLKEEKTQVLAKKEIYLNSKLIHNFDCLTLITRIIVFQDVKIELNESGLTLPIIVGRGNQLKDTKSCEITYKIDKVPGYVINWK
ncbi:hypothetical protein [Flavobacterium sp. J27]|uniref:hypothetical protein n=1 Tax=Flavobacterium sp. J27 TaxID=2060419 RepID=UPI00102FFB89|nr:hypothetical protein [Flavobacterium sp. J27]